MDDNLNELEMAKKRDHKIVITDEAISKVPRIKYKDIPENEYDNIQELAKSVLKISKDENDSNEVAVTYSLRSDKLIERGERYIGVALGSEHSVDPLSDTTAYHLVSSEEECVIIVLHNHPSLSDFSLTDVQFLLEYDNVKMMVVVTNLGSISYLVKRKNYNQKDAIALFNKAVKKNNDAKDLKALQDAADYFLKSSYNVGICYDNR
jgi:proteasome lid subunit RPN8/RPN11